jgi:hypothetical protein
MKKSAVPAMELKRIRRKVPRHIFGRDVTIVALGSQIGVTRDEILPQGIGEQIHFLHWHISWTNVGIILFD